MSIFKKTTPIRLAVVGNASSGKSFLLKDIIDALRSMGCSFFASDTLEKRDGFQYKPFSNYAPNQKGGGGGTPLYACRHEDHYGQRVIGPDFEFDLSFLNIPGEIFQDAMLNSYNELKRMLMTRKKLFTVYPYTNPAGDERLIVRPNENVYRVEDDVDGSDTLSAAKDAYLQRFKSWPVIVGELSSARFVAGKPKNISGEDLMMDFFKYDTDSVMLSIYNLIKGRIFPNLDFDHEDFDSMQYDLAFVFFHYCTLATDIVVCDRVYTHLDKDAELQKEKLGFNDLAVKLSQFLDKQKLANHVNTYMAFRNVDFLIQKPEVEEAYVQLNKRMKKMHLPLEQRRNAIYSLFSYLMFDHIGYDMRDLGGSMNHILGLEDDCRLPLLDDEPTAGADDAGHDPDAAIDESTIERLKQRYIDIQGSEGHVFNARTLEEHITSRVGGQGQAFRMLLTQTGWYSDNHDTFVPHVYFTCTPITEDYLVYRNGRKDKENQDEFDFYRDGSPTKFSDTGSRACFGSFQLCMDIFYKHNIGSFGFGGMLQRIIDVV